MNQSFEIEIGETERFQLDCALYGLERELHSRALSILRSDPVVGTQRTEVPNLWDWSFRTFRITYGLSSDLSRLVLLRVVPEEAPKSQALARILTVIRTINDIKRLFGY